MPRVNQVICDACRKPKKRVAVDKYYKVMVNERGERWFKRTCPACVTGKWKSLNCALRREARIANKEWPGPDLQEELSKRPCRACNKLLPVSRYFFHERCAPKSEDYEAEDYGHFPPFFSGGYISAESEMLLGS